MSKIVDAIQAEKDYIAARANGVDYSLPEKMKEYGFNSLEEYFRAKRNYLVSASPVKRIDSAVNLPVKRIDVKAFSDKLERAIMNGEYGIYILTVSTPYFASYGSETPDFELCEKLNVEPLNLHYKGGTIIGSNMDLPIELVIPSNIGFTADDFINGLYTIIRKYFTTAEIDRNDILIDGKKVVGSMWRNIGDVSVVAAQITYGEYGNLIEQICQKQSVKTVGRIDSDILPKETLESEVLKWLKTQ